VTSPLRDHGAAPAQPHLVASIIIGLVTGLTAPLLLVGLARRVAGDVPPGLAALVVLGWGAAVVVVMNAVLPWRRLVVARVRRDRCALISAQATRGEQTAYHARWLLESSVWALAWSLPVVLIAVATVAELLDPPVAPRLAWGALGDLVGVIMAGSSTAYTCRMAADRNR